MNMENEILWIIPAREGSKSIKDKNIALVNGIHLLGYRLLSALSISNKEDVWISTNNKEYAAIAAHYGATVPFIRPEDLSTDTASSIDVCLHALENAKKNYKYLGLLEPTSPFITKDILKEGINILDNDNLSSSVVTVREVRPNPIFSQKHQRYLDILYNNLKDYSDLRRQNFNDIFVTPSGGLYLTKIEALYEYKSFYTPFTRNILIDDFAGIEIDEPIDLVWATFLIENNYIDTSLIY